MRFLSPPKDRKKNAQGAFSWKGAGQETTGKQDQTQNQGTCLSAISIITLALIFRSKIRLYSEKLPLTVLNILEGNTIKKEPTACATEHYFIVYKLQYLLVS